MILDKLVKAAEGSLIIRAILRAGNVVPNDQPIELVLGDIVINRNQLEGVLSGNGTTVSIFKYDGKKLVCVADRVIANEYLHLVNSPKVVDYIVNSFKPEVIKDIFIALRMSADEIAYILNYQLYVNGGQVPAWDEVLTTEN